VLRSKDKNFFISKYLGYCCQDQRFIEKIVSKSVGVSYPAISSWRITEISIAYSNVKDQKEIVDYLEKNSNNRI